jgi:hypothetical protein
MGSLARVRGMRVAGHMHQRYVPRYFASLPSRLALDVVAFRRCSAHIMIEEKHRPMPETLTGGRPMRDSARGDLCVL